MVDAAAALWSAVPTAGVSLAREGSLNEDVSGANIVPGNQAIAQPSDVALGHQLSRWPSSTTPTARCSTRSSAPTPAIRPTARPTASWPGSTTSIPTPPSPTPCMVLNGRCATTPNLVSMMQFQLERAFGPILGLGYAQVNPGALRNGEPDGTQGWPVMQPISGVCGPAGGICIPDPGNAALRRHRRPQPHLSHHRRQPCRLSRQGADRRQHRLDRRAPSRSAPALGMQGVNVVARPLDANGNPLYQYTVTVGLGRLFQRQSRQPGHRLDRCQRQSPLAVGLERCHPCRATSTCATCRCPRA